MGRTKSGKTLHKGDADGLSESETGSDGKGMTAAIVQEGFGPEEQ
jgi:hypothetical protein